ncbi:hypothetical protein CpipJ_CPIJ005605 [Culex quinquefasciatus]|uniref:Uncharacterized protein n=1 Tax=Culex quinquefasciatus TaxID=7176 RepID=B0WEC3_CULQU|nr:hypothetical protein CpipJ_CPIJ005605 [Culex quinquefasciatus]|eukprot:XP_001847057.1 hypothetical protein CpipJ_CPIJ005605 [Culex quinquefasciatus]
MLPSSSPQFAPSSCLVGNSPANLLSERRRFFPYYSAVRFLNYDSIDFPCSMCHDDDDDCYEPERGVRSTAVVAATVTQQPSRDLPENVAARYIMQCSSISRRCDDCADDDGDVDKLMIMELVPLRQLPAQLTRENVTNAAAT